MIHRKIWIINHYAGNMYFDKGGRHYWFAKYLKKAGYSPVVFCCNVIHNHGNERYVDSNELWTEQCAEEIEVPFVFVKARSYTGNGKQRVLNMVDFYQNVKKTAKEYARKNGKPDVILASSVHPLTMVAGIQLAKKFHIKCICEVRDLWPEAIVAYSSKIKKNGLPARVMYAGEKWIYKKASAVIFTQEGGPDYVKEHRWNKECGGPIDMNNLFHINNGVDLSDFDDNLNKYYYSDMDLDNEEFFKVVYCGSVRRVNNLGLIVDAAKYVTTSNIRFIIFGDGDELEFLKNRVKNEHLDNIVFKGSVKKQYIPSIVSRADLNLAHWEMTPLLRVGESCNKTFEYLASGKPMFCTVRPGYSIVEKYHCGCLTDGFEPEDIAKGIENFIKQSSEEKDNMAANAREAAYIYDFKNLTQKLISIIER